MKTRVLVVDYMALARQALVRGLGQAGLAEVVATASSPRLCRRKLLDTRPDVVVIDLEPPVDEGARRFRQLMLEHPGGPLPVLLLTALDGAQRAAAMEILGLGLRQVILKPATRLAEGLGAMMADVERGVNKAHQDHLSSRWRAAPSTAGPPAPAPAPPDAAAPAPPTAATAARVIAVGASTGGTEALADVLARVPRGLPGIVIVQHMPEGFTRPFARRLDALSPLRVKEAEDGDPIRPGHVLVAPGGLQTRAVRAGDGLAVHVTRGEKVNGHRPSVDVLMHSVAKAAGARAVGVLLTGMGDDGAAGLKAMRDAGAATFAQDEATSVVFGMPKAAYRCGGAQRLVALRDIPSHLLACLGLAGG